MVAVVILLRVQREYRSGGNKLSNVRSFIILSSGEGLTSFSINNCTNFFGERKYNEAFRGVYIFLLFFYYFFFF